MNKQKRNRLTDRINLAIIGKTGGGRNNTGIGD